MNGSLNSYYSICQLDSQQSKGVTRREEVRSQGDHHRDPAASEGTLAGDDYSEAASASLLKDLWASAVGDRDGPDGGQSAGETAAQPLSPVSRMNLDVR
jgi:hypothetical protein